MLMAPSLSQDEGRRASALVSSEAYIYLPNGVGKEV